ncbi:ABC transporter permease subunit [Methanocella conradii]|uniref:ABC transporter permease subunit n=1 Tax=Methanocella conradii TaxID=1175444 RepID=UPI0024B3AB69|nr:ABC transporter permease subunit [Methanocella conradii]
MTGWDVMGNLVRVARKEFSDLTSSTLMLIILIWYFIQFLIVVYTHVYPFDGMPSLISYYDNPAELFFSDFAIMLCKNGSILGIVLGFVSVASEVDGHALNILLMKPLYRDTVINGKLLGVIGFILCLFCFTAFLFIMALSLYSVFILDAHAPGSLSVYLSTFVSYLPLALVLSLLCILLTYSITLLMCQVFKNQSLALFLSLFIWVILFVLMDNVLLAGNVGFFAGRAAQDFIASLSPYNMVGSILSERDLYGALAYRRSQFFTLFLYCFVALVLSYIAFLRRDIS